tara:strand:+ start:240 stop:434 length:195 start_codon:yes stop_codon:yes gene_type:complete
MVLDFVSTMLTNILVKSAMEILYVYITILELLVSYVKEEQLVFMENKNIHVNCAMVTEYVSIIY